VFFFFHPWFSRPCFFVVKDLDPLFVLLPLLPSGQFRPLGDVLSEGGPAFAKLAAKDKSLFQRVAAICDVKVEKICFALCSALLLLLETRKFPVWMVNLFVCLAQRLFVGCCAKWTMRSKRLDLGWREGWRLLEEQRWRARWWSKKWRRMWQAKPCLKRESVQLPWNWFVVLLLGCFLFLSALLSDS
jgi:hypothetical protein